MITLYGIHPVLEALKKRPRAVKSIHLARQGSDKALTQISELALQYGITVRASTQQELIQLSGSSQHQGIAAEAEPFPLSDIDDVIARVAPQQASAAFSWCLTACRTRKTRARLSEARCAAGRRP